jgi:hypothetical protein
MPVRSALRTNLARLLSFTACCNLLAPFSAILSPAADRAKLLFVPRASSRRAHFHLPAPVRRMPRHLHACIHPSLDRMAS